MLDMRLRAGVWSRRDSAIAHPSLLCPQPRPCPCLVLSASLQGPGLDPLSLFGGHFCHLCLQLFSSLWQPGPRLLPSLHCWAGGWDSCGAGWAWAGRGSLCKGDGQSPSQWYQGSQNRACSQEIRFPKNSISVPLCYGLNVRVPLKALR